MTTDRSATANSTFAVVRLLSNGVSCYAIRQLNGDAFGAHGKSIRNKVSSKLEQIELISPTAKEVKIRDTIINIEQDSKKYEAVGIKLQALDNPDKLIGFGDLVRYLNETLPAVINATEGEIKKHIPGDLPKIITINDFHYTRAYDKDNPPGRQETCQLIAKILVTGDSALWKPTLKANNHWRNWESGNL